MVVQVNWALKKRQNSCILEILVLSYLWHELQETEESKKYQAAKGVLLGIEECDLKTRFCLKQPYKVSCSMFLAR